VKKLYGLLEKKCPEKIVTLMEAFIGLLRNAEKVNSSDVEVSCDNLNIFSST